MESTNNKRPSQKIIRSLASHQIAALIKKGKWVDELKVEWLKRWGMEFPYYKDITGIKEMM